MERGIRIGVRIDSRYSEIGRSRDKDRDRLRVE